MVFLAYEQLLTLTVQLAPSSLAPSSSIAHAQEDRVCCCLASSCCL